MTASRTTVKLTRASSLTGPEPENPVLSGFPRLEHPIPGKADIAFFWPKIDFLIDT